MNKGKAQAFIFCVTGLEIGLYLKANFNSPTHLSYTAFIAIFLIFLFPPIYSYLVIHMKAIGMSGLRV